MDITANMVKDLREKSGAGMMDAKKALVENGGDMEKAMDWLRTKGIAKAAKKADRVAAEGMVWAISNGSAGAMVEVNAETDFSSKNEKFTSFAKAVAELALNAKTSDVDAIKALPMDGATVQEKLTDLVATVGENMTIRRAMFMEAQGGTVGAYVHMNGKIGVLTQLAGKADAGTVAKQVAMHVAATNPQSLDRTSLNPDVLAREKAIYVEQAKASGKPDNVVEKMVEGRMNKFAEEVCLVDQAFVMNPDQKVKDVVAQAGVTLTGFARFGLGEGIEKKQEDFAAEVAKAAAV